MRRIIFLSFFLMVLGSGCQNLDQKAIDSVFIEWDKPGVPGCALGIFKDGKVLYSRGYGLANLEYGIPNSAQSVFRIASTSKQFTAACIILLAQDGKLSLDDDLKSIFPDFPEYAGRITIRHLLNHTSGIRDYLQLAYLKGLGDDDYYEDEEIMRWLVNQTDLNFNPGDEFLYSNSGYWLLGQIVRTVSGMNMRDFADERIFRPLQMTNTHFHNDHAEIVMNRASGYLPDKNGDYKISMTTLDMIGDGGIFTTIDDIKKWDDAFYNSEVFGKEFWSEMTRQAILNNGEQIEYASGLSIGEYKGLSTIRHGGAFVGFRAEMLRFPEEHLTIAIFANRSDANPSRKAERIADILLKDKLLADEKPEANKLLNEDVSEEYSRDQVTGDYEIQTGVSVKITVAGDSLKVVQNWNKRSYKIGRVKGNIFRSYGNTDTSFAFSELEDGFTQTLTIVQFDRTTTSKRKRTMDTSKVDLFEFEGDYFSPELNVVYSLSVVNDSLKLRINGKMPEMDCDMSDTDQFSAEYGVMRFKRDNGVISGFELDSGRVKNLKFEKK